MSKSVQFGNEFVILKKQIDVSFSCVCRWVYAITPWIHSNCDNVMTKFMINNVQDRCMKNWCQFVKLKKIWFLVFLWLMEVSKSSQLLFNFNFSVRIFLGGYLLAYTPYTGMQSLDLDDAEPVFSHL